METTETKYYLDSTWDTVYATNGKLLISAGENSGLHTTDQNINEQLNAKDLTPITRDEFNIKYMEIVNSINSTMQILN